MSRDATQARYLDQLMATYGFEAPVEAALSLTPGLASVIDVRSRARSRFIVEDLLSLGLTPSRIARLPQCRRIAPFRDAVEALGWLYLVERATLLHDNLRRRLASRWPDVSAWRYLGAYENIVGGRWRELGIVLDRIAPTPAIGAEIVGAARAAFECHREWFASEPVAAQA